MPDEFFGGKDDLTAAVGYEKNGVTTILFRKKITGIIWFQKDKLLFLIFLFVGTELTDFSIENKPMTIIWAVGQSKGQYSHRPASGLERGNPGIADFYRPDEVKYHGKDNRGFATVNFHGR